MIKKRAKRAKLENYSVFCGICGKALSNHNGLGVHIKSAHHLQTKEYYDIYYKKDNEGLCDICGKETSFYGLRSRYALTCGGSCAASHPSTKEKRKKTTLERYGVENIFQSKEFHAKGRQTMLERYGDANYNVKKAQKTQLEKYGGLGLASPVLKERAKKTTLEKYGVDHVLKSKQVQEKAAQTKVERYGNKCNYEKVKKTNLERYGVEHSFSRPEVVEKSKQTCLERYGVDNYGKTDEFKENYAQHCLDKFGATSYLGSEEGKKKLKEIQFQAFGKWRVQTGEFMEKAQSTKIKNGTQNQSYKEDFVYNFIKNYYFGPIERNNFKLIDSDLDFYFPELNLAVEFNGSYWHSVEAKGEQIKYYHLNKSLACREKGIRLVHIYEFEDIKTQLDHLVSLLNGNDTYPKQDFNKNNLLDYIPEPFLVQNDFSIYTAGPLQEELFN